MNMLILRRRLLHALAALAVVVPVAGWAVPCCLAEEKLSLEQHLRQQAPQILGELSNQKLRRVGVLKFRVETRPGVVTDNCGPFNMRLAEQLEAALALANPREAQQQIELVRKASDVARGLKGASHLTPAGRTQLFSASYPLAWGDSKVTVDAFVTGVVQLAPSLKTIRVNILVVRPGQSGLKVLVPPITIATDATILSELSGSFHLRGPGGEDPATLAQQSRERPAERFPLQDRPSVSLKIFYDKKPVDLEFRDEGAWIPEPREGQVVAMQLERLDRVPGALGAVLKVNGENTLYRERQRAVDCSRWVLHPGRGPKSVEGFYFDKDRLELFRVASQKESSALEMNYGPDLGMISLVVFREASADAPTLRNEEAQDLAAIAKAEFPDQPAHNPEALKAQLRDIAAESQIRGMVVPGREIKRPLEIERLKWDPAPVLSVAIRYYQPKK